MSNLFHSLFFSLLKLYSFLLKFICLYRVSPNSINEFREVIVDIKRMKNYHKSSQNIYLFIIIIMPLTRPLSAGQYVKFCICSLDGNGLIASCEDLLDCTLAFCDCIAFYFFYHIYYCVGSF